MARKPRASNCKRYTAPHPDALEVKARIQAAYKMLRKDGYTTRSNFQCCQSCAWSELAHEDKNERVVFYHKQDAETLEKYGRTHLAWAGVGHAILFVLKDAGLDVEWDGGDDQRFCVSLPVHEKVLTPTFP